MLRIDELCLQPGEDPELLRALAAKRLGLPTAALTDFHILRRSVDARGSVKLRYSVGCSCKGEARLVRRLNDSKIYIEKRYRYTPPPRRVWTRPRPVIVGAGPAGLFCALVLTKAGANPILLEQGQCVEQRKQDVDYFFRTGLLNPSSNVQFGEGGAGAFSDGKLSTGTHDPRNRWILSQLVEHGAPPEILIDAKPHVGTDRLFSVLQSLRQTLLDNGCEIRFGAKMERIRLTDGRVSGVDIRSCCDSAIDTDTLILAVGHSARDTFDHLYRLGVPMEQKAFAVGVRIEHLQRSIDLAQYGRFAGHPALPVSSYKLSCHLNNGHSAFSFCVCPGGQVVAAASEQGRLVTNGMSEYARDRETINGGFLVGVGSAELESSHPLAGIDFQRKLEEAAFAAGGGGFLAPAQTVGDFLAGRPSTALGRVIPSYRPGVKWCDLHTCLPPFLSETLAAALPIFGRRISGFDDPDAVMTAVESRSSCPVRILRDQDTCQSPVGGLYPCGEGAGWAGGIISAAADGIRCAEKILEG